MSEKPSINFNELVKNQAKYDGRVIVIKFGGALAENDDVIRHIASQAAFLSNNIKAKVIVVHGGGKQIDDALVSAGIETKRDDNGLRITDLETLKVSDGSLRALNGHIVSLFHGASRNSSAVGMAGFDGRAIGATVLNEFTGTSNTVDTAYLNHLMGFNKGVIPVIYPICYNTEAQEGELRLNVNADDVAATLAIQLRASRLILCSDIPGVLDRNKNLLSRLSLADVDRLIEDGIVTGGMIPKIRAAADVAKSLDKGGVVILDGRKENAILAELLGEGTGTLIERAKPPSIGKPAPQ